MANFGYLEDEPQDGPCPHNRFYRIAGNPVLYCDICDLPAGDNFPVPMTAGAPPTRRRHSGAIVAMAYLGLVLGLIWAARLA